MPGTRRSRSAGVRTPKTKPPRKGGIEVLSLVSTTLEGLRALRKGNPMQSRWKVAERILVAIAAIITVLVGLLDIAERLF